MIAPQDLSQLLDAARTGPCVTLYQPTQRSFPESQQNSIRFRNLIREVEASLGERAKSDVGQALLGRLRELANDTDFWLHPRDGVAVFAAPGFFRVMQLQRPVETHAAVADSFHIKPLLRSVQSAGRFQVLALNRRSIRLYEGDRDVLDEIPLAAGVPRTIDEALSSEAVASNSLAQSRDNREPSGGAGEHIDTRAGQKRGGVHRSHSNVKDSVDLEVDRFFRAVDRAITEHHSKPSGLPLVLAALPEYQTPFRELSHNPQLAAAGIDVNPDALSTDQLRERAWEAIRPGYEERLAQLIDRFGAANGTGLGSERLQDVVEAALSGRVDTLLVDADRKVPGRIDRQSRKFLQDGAAKPEVDDALDDLAECVLRTGGNVVIVPGERMPTRTGLAAIYRY